MRDEQGTTATPVVDAALPIHVQRDDGRVATATLPPRDPGGWDEDARVARFSRAVADRVREALAREQVLDAVVKRLDDAASEAVRRALHTRLSPVLYDVLRTARGEAGIACATNLLDDRLSDAIEQQVSDALRDQIGSVVRDRLGPVLADVIGAREAPAALDAATGIDLPARLQRATELGMRERLRDGLRGTIRERVREAARTRVAETLRFATAEAPDESATDGRFVAATAAVIESAVYDDITSGVRDRLRVIVANSIHEAVGGGARFGDGLRRPWDAAATACDDDHRGTPRDRAVGNVPLTGERFGELVMPYVADAVRDELTCALRERLELAARRAIDDALRDRLAQAIRVALADQRRWDGLDLRRFAETVRRQLADALRAPLNEALRAEAMDLLRSRLDAAVQLGVARGAASR